MTATVPELSTCPVLDQFTFDMTPSLTWVRRQGMWWPPTREQYDADHRLGTLRIILSVPSKGGSGFEVDDYAVDRVDQQGSNRMGFYLHNLTDPDQEDVYQCHVPSGSGFSSCTCTAGRVKRFTCKHVDALEIIVKEGLL